MFKPVSPKLNVTSMEENVLKFWKQHEIFKKTVEQRQGGPEYVYCLLLNRSGHCVENCCDYSPCPTRQTVRMQDNLAKTLRSPAISGTSFTAEAGEPDFALKIQASL